MNEFEYSTGESEKDGALASQIRLMFRAFWSSKARNGILANILVIIVVILITIFGQLRLNAWNQPFYDAIAQKNLKNFLIQLGAIGSHVLE